MSNRFSKKNKSFVSLGLMSGTSTDGLDLALLQTDGEDFVEKLGFCHIPYAPALKMRLKEACRLAQSTDLSQEENKIIKDLEQEFTDFCAQKIETFLKTQATLPLCIGFHGHTLFHDPKEQKTMALGDGQRLANRLRLPVIHSLRANDVAHKGEGAPLVPVYHRALAQKKASLPICFLNLGGVANLTWIAETGEMIAFDCGPGNGLLDDWVFSKTGFFMDEGGKFAFSGNISFSFVEDFLKHAYFQRPPPKSLDRHTFSCLDLASFSLEDGCATLAECTASAVAHSTKHLPQTPKFWIVCGGGRHNAFLMERLQKQLISSVLVAEDFGIEGEKIEAEAWAYLAVRHIKNLPISWPKTTGAPFPLCGGICSKPED